MPHAANRPPAAASEADEGRWNKGQFPVAEALAESVLSLPLDPSHSDREIDFVIDRVKAFFSA